MIQVTINLLENHIELTFIDIDIKNPYLLMLQKYKKETGWHGESQINYP